MNFECFFCKAHFVIQESDPELKILFCPNCGASLNKEESHHGSTFTESKHSAFQSIYNENVALITGQAPLENDIQFSIGPYQIIQSIGKGGMGEVFLAYDTTCGRRIALKRIRTDLIEHQQMHSRFLKEARVTSQLTHPSIIPIYAIHAEENLVYYTMPFVEGETLKQIIRDTKKNEKKEDSPHLLGSSIPSLVRAFLSVCQAVAYAHSKGVLHRDLKSENIIIGKYGEVLILDWGLAKLMRSPQEADEDDDFQEIKKEKYSLHQLTRIGKVVGTVAYMAPERAVGQPATPQTDVYSLGVILYQLLALRLPFRRGTLKEFRKSMSEEALYNPAEIAPYRDVPRILSVIVSKCLAPLSDRYHTVDELVRDIENYIEGRSEWFKETELKIDNKNDWEFQENVLIAEHIAITRSTETSDWVSLMVSKESFWGNTKIEARVCIGEKGSGLGFLLNIPEAEERIHLNDGYCLWIGSELNKSTKLLRTTVEVLHAPEIFLRRHEWYDIRIEKIENSLYFYLNDALQFSYISHLPLVGTHIGLLSYDADFAASPLSIYVGSQSINLSCVAVPDALLAHKNYTAALNEYRRIGYSFPGRAEGREALFKAGITLLEEAKDQKDPSKNKLLSELALDEFTKLHHTPGAPLEYLGKALVYRYLQDIEEETKCFELAFRRYPQHPLLSILYEQMIGRMHESARKDRRSTYHFILLAIRYIPNITSNLHVSRLFLNLQTHWEPLYFIEGQKHPSAKIQNATFGIQLSFWLSKAFTIVEWLKELSQEDPLSSSHLVTIENALFALIEMGEWQKAQINLNELGEKIPKYNRELLQIAIDCQKNPLKSCAQRFCILVPKQLTKKEMRIIFYIMRYALNTFDASAVHHIIKKLKSFTLSEDGNLRLNINEIWAYLLEKNWKKAGELLHQYPLEFLTQESTTLHFLYGCWLSVSEGNEIGQAHFSSVLDVTYPRTWALFSHFISGQIQENSEISNRWLAKTFSWEKRKLYQQLVLFYHCIGNEEKLQHYIQLEKEQYSS